MAKTNFTKVEEVMDQGLRKYSVDSLLEQADLAAGGKEKPRNPSIAYAAEASQPKPPPLTKEHSQLIHALQRDLKRLQSLDPALYNLLGISKKKLTQMMGHPNDLASKDWEKIQQVKTKLDQHKKELQEKLPKPTDEALIESERKEHINRRYNVNKKWLPLT